MSNLPSLPARSGEHAPSPAAAPASAENFDVESIPLDGMTVMQLLALHTKIEAKLPPTSLSKVSLERTLMLQLIAAQELQKLVLEDKDATPTHKSQVTNTLSTVIDTLSKLQIKLFSSERMKEIEGALIDTVNEHMTPEAAAVFFAEYRRRLGAEAA